MWFFIYSNRRRLLAVRTWSLTLQKWSKIRKFQVRNYICMYTVFQFYTIFGTSLKIMMYTIIETFWKSWNIQSLKLFENHKIKIDRIMANGIARRCRKGCCSIFYRFIIFVRNCTGSSNIALKQCVSNFFKWLGPLKVSNKELNKSSGHSKLYRSPLNVFLWIAKIIRSYITNRGPHYHFFLCLIHCAVDRGPVWTEIQGEGSRGSGCDARYRSSPCTRPYRGEIRAKEYQEEWKGECRSLGLSSWWRYSV